MLSLRKLFTGRSDSAWFAAILCWVVALVAGWLWTFHYEFSVDAPTAAYDHEVWPASTSLALASDRPTLVYFVHPRCPCTRASTRQLERLLSPGSVAAADLPRVLVLATVPEDASSDWRGSSILRAASKLPHAELVLDPEGQHTSHFGAISSGTVMLYDAEGRRKFAGGVTPSRGHEGASAGIDALRTLLATSDNAPTCTTPTFGCRLCTQSDE